MEMIKTAVRVCALFAGAALTMAAPAAAEFPERPVSIIVPAAPGGTTDALARLLARFMSETLGQNMVVENVGGAGGSVAMNRIRSARPDGYTLVFGNMGQIGANPAVHPDLGFDPREDVAAIGIMADVPMVLAASNASGITTVDEFVAFMKENPGAVDFGSSGPGSTGYLAPMLFMRQNSLEGEILNYQGAGPALVDLMAGLTEAQIDQTVMMSPVHAEKQATILAVTGPERSAGFEDVPTFTEAGYPEFDLVVWNGLVAPAGTEEEVLVALEAAYLETLKMPDFVEAVERLGAAVPAQDRRGREAFTAIIDAEVGRWLDVLEVAQN
jgi:tripartite-type tricarboxylate transporter receptor subunit TctC